MFHLQRRLFSGFVGLTITIGLASCSSSSPSVVATDAQETPTTTVLEPAVSEPAVSEPAVSEPAVGETVASATDVSKILTGSGEATWMLVSRSENGSAPASVECAKDDLLVFKSSGKFDSVIGGTQCNPQEVEVKDGTFALAPDNKVITFTVPQFAYTGTLQVATPDRIVIEFDLGTAKVTDEFILKR
jgi:hypothetical protein